MKVFRVLSIVAVLVTFLFSSDFLEAGRIKKVKEAKADVVTAFKPITKTGIAKRKGTEQKAASYGVDYTEKMAKDKSLEERTAARKRVKKGVKEAPSDIFGFFKRKKEAVGEKKKGLAVWKRKKEEGIEGLSPKEDEMLKEPSSTDDLRPPALKVSKKELEGLIPFKGDAESELFSSLKEDVEKKEKFPISEKEVSQLVGFKTEEIDKVEATLRAGRAAVDGSLLTEIKDLEKRIDKAVVPYLKQTLKDELKEKEKFREALSRDMDRIAENLKVSKAKQEELLSGFRGRLKDEGVDVPDDDIIKLLVKKRLVKELSPLGKAEKNLSDAELEVSVLTLERKDSLKVLRDAEEENREALFRTAKLKNDLTQIVDEDEIKSKENEIIKAMRKEVEAREVLDVAQGKLSGIDIGLEDAKLSRDRAVGSLVVVKEEAEVQKEKDFLAKMPEDMTIIQKATLKEMMKSEVDREMLDKIPFEKMAEGNKRLFFSVASDSNGKKDLRKFLRSRKYRKSENKGMGLAKFLGKTQSKIDTRKEKETRKEIELFTEEDLFDL